MCDFEDDWLNFSRIGKRRRRRVSWVSFREEDIDGRDDGSRLDYTRSIHEDVSGRGERQRTLRSGPFTGRRILLREGSVLPCAF